MERPPRSPSPSPAAPVPLREPEESGGSQILPAEGCSLCRKASAWDEKYRFWFLHEHYSFPETLDRLTRSLGFCFFHGAQTALDPTGQSSLAFVHHVLARRLGSILARERSKRSTRTAFLPPFAAPDRCPACKDRDDARGRALSSLAAEIEPAESDPRPLEGSLCVPDFQALVSRLSLPAIRRVLPLYETALSTAMDAGSGGTDDDPLRRALHLVAGDRPSTDSWVPPPPGKPASTLRTPVADFLEELSADESCPVCREMGRAWTEWMGWLADNLARGMEVRDLLPVCPGHLRATFLLADRPLAAASVRHAAGLARNLVRQGMQTLSPSPVPDRKGTRFRLGRLFRRDERPVRRVRRSLGRPLPCPVCHRLSVAGDRALLLLFALLESPRHQARFAGGYGLCLGHFSRSLALNPSGRIGAILLEVMASKLALLQWELEESMRKDAWMFRPEAAGTEHTAWERAIRRFSGSFPMRSE
jgi:hypothetical protein